MIRMHTGARLAVLLAGLTVGFGAGAAPFFTYVTGEALGGDVIFKVTLDPTIAASATISTAATDARRLDGIDFLPGSTSSVSLGAQTPGGGCAIAGFDFSTSTGVSYVPATGAGTKPSTVLNNAGHVYYIENQFGFGGGAHRIMRTPFGGPPGTTELVFERTGIVNLEGLEIHAGKLYFFAADPATAGTRALFSAALTAGVVAGATVPAKLLGGLKAAPAGDGSDELDWDPFTGYIFGTNMINGEVIYWNPAAMTGGFLISPADLATAAPGSGVARFSTAKLDGIRATGDGYLVLTGLDGVIASIDIVGAFAGVDAGDVKILYDGPGFSGTPSIHFDDLTPLVPLPTPGSLCLVGIGLASICFSRRRSIRFLRRTL